MGGIFIFLLKKSINAFCKLFVTPLTTRWWMDPRSYMSLMLNDCKQQHKNHVLIPCMAILPRYFETTSLKWQFWPRISFAMTINNALTNNQQNKIS
jgi:hypothetical protein